MLSDWLKSERINQGLTQKEISDKIGISRRVYLNLENGNEPSLYAYKKLSNYYKRSIKYFVKQYEKL